MHCSRRIVAVIGALGLGTALYLPAAAGATAPSPAAPSYPQASTAWAALHRALPLVGAAGFVHAANTVTVNQPGNPTDVNGNPVVEPQSAVISTSATYTAASLHLSLKPAQYTDPTSDPNWQNAGGNTFFLFVFGTPGSRTLTAVGSLPSGGTTKVAALKVLVDDKGNLTFSPLACPGLGYDLGPASHAYSVSVPNACFGNLPTVSWFAILGYDPIPSDKQGADGFTDLAPEHAPLPSVNPYDDTQGYWLFAGDGGVFAEGNARFFGSLGNVHLAQPIVAAAGVPGGSGYWMTAADGGVFTFGHAQFFGSLGTVPLAQPVVTMAARPQGDGYWLFAGDGGVFSFGKAAFHGSLGNVHLAQPIVAGFASADGGGYTLVAADGGVFTFGDAPYKGSLGSAHLAQPVVTGAPTPTGKGYWLFAKDGGVFAFGDARFLGSTGATHLASPIVSATTAPGGYRMAAADGGVFSFGAPFEGSQGATPLAQPIVAMASDS
jgi:hypothetical protein